MSTFTRRTWLLVTGFPAGALTSTTELLPGVFASSPGPEMPAPVRQHLETRLGWRGGLFSQPDIAFWTDTQIAQPNIVPWNDPAFSVLDRVFDSLSYVLTSRATIEGPAFTTVIEQSSINTSARLAPMFLRGNRTTVLDVSLWSTLLRRLVKPLERSEVAMYSAARSFERACRERDDNDRLELFCRSLETLIQPGKGGTAQKFAERIAAELGPAADPRRLTRYVAAYYLRNGIMHGYRFIHRASGTSPVTGMLEQLSRRILVQTLTDDVRYESTLRRQRAVLDTRAAAHAASRKKSRG